MDIHERINHLIELTEGELKKYIKYDSSGIFRMYDPQTNTVLKEHYGDTHYCTALLIRSIQVNDSIQIEIAKNMLNNILDNIVQDSNLVGYHNDFNLFALCISFDYLENDECLSTKIKEKVLQISDSNHLTTNWLPMRIFVNLHRYDWTKNIIYLNKCNKLIDSINKVTYDDGIVDDRYPKGLSYNLQYNVATVASLLYTYTKYDINIDLDSNLNSLMGLIFPDGDINYFGRGTNQVFAWGLWIYLLSTSKMQKELEISLMFLEKHIPEMLSNQNIFLNKRKGNDKYMWWDYHYSSVYISHLYLWLVLSLQDIDKFNLDRKNPIISDSGIDIFQNNECKIILFNGRKEYLSEQGPSIAGIWTRKHGTIKKGYFGPWGGAFGNKFMEKDITLKNFIGLLNIEVNKENFIKKIIRRIIRKIGFYKSNKIYQYIRPVFSKIQIESDKGNLKISFETKSKKDKFMNFPFYMSSSLSVNDIVVYADNQVLDMILVGKIEDQYGLCDLYQSKSNKARKWDLVIKL